jgi:PIN domain nuclease of toxin-antitoxin system
MRVMVDTHAYIWANEAPGRLGADALAAINDGNNQRFISVATIWEMAIKLKTGRLTLAGGISLASFVTQSLTQLKLTLLDIRYPHALIPESLPLHHTDPFDRILVAQAMYENMPIVSIDDKLDAYGVQRIW